MKLTPAQQHAKDTLRRARVAQKAARTTFEAEMEIAWRERSAQVTQNVHDAIREAVRLGIPKRQMQEAYGSKDYNTIRRLIEQVTVEHTTAVEQSVQVSYNEQENAFTVVLKDFDDWTDPENSGPMSGVVTYGQDAVLGDWVQEMYDDVSNAVERELWQDTPLRAEVAKHVPLDSLPDVVQDGDYEDDSDLPGMWERADFK